MKNIQLLSQTGIQLWRTDDGTNREATREGAGLRELLGTNTRWRKESWSEKNGRTESGGW